MVRPELLVMDEPTSGLDPLMEVRFREVLADGLEHGQTALLSSHILSEVDAACDRVGIVRAGRLVEVGPLAELRRRALCPAGSAGGVSRRRRRCARS